MSQQLQHDPPKTPQLAGGDRRHSVWEKRIPAVSSTWFGHPVSPFQVCGVIGFLSAFAMARGLAELTGLSFRVLAAISLTGVFAFLAMAAATKVITGEEQLVYYQQEIAIVLSAFLQLKIVNRPVLPYLDVTILGLAVILAFGRIGCLLVGCCHGRPFDRGICYRKEHTAYGFPPHLIGVWLFPIQLMECVWVFGVVICGFIMLLHHSAPGAALAFYTVTYGGARFAFEFLRGDTDRPYTFGFSQGQWLSLWLMSALIWAEWSHRMPFRPWHSLALAGLLTVMFAVTLHRRFDRSQRFRILHPSHVREVAAALNYAIAPAALPGQRMSGCKSQTVRVDCTSLGIQISRGVVSEGPTPAVHYAFSRRGPTLNEPSALLLAHLVLKLTKESHDGKLVAGVHGVFHLLLPNEQRNGAVA
jgi:prolipoprotein diacylglyceryl transferase